LKKKSLGRKPRPSGPPLPSESLGPLPTADRNSELQRRSLGALRALLPNDKFVFRDERIDDAGVDGSLELLIDSAYTDLRSQVQIKSTESTPSNRDGTISISINVSNLNYLLNGPSALYLLYVAPAHEFRFAWASDERKRLDRTNSDWINQKTVTLRFGNVLSKKSFEQIHERIRREAQFRRQVTDILDTAGSLEHVVIRIATDTLKITDAAEAKRVLQNSGIAIVSSGYASEVKELSKLLNEDDLRLPRILLVLAHAEYMLGRYLTSIALIKEATLRIEELSQDDQLFLQALGDACDYQTGRLEANKFIERTTESLKNSSSPFSIALELNRLRQILLNDSEPEHRSAVLGELQTLVGKIKDLNQYSSPFKLYARISLAEAEGYQVVLLTMRTIGEARIKRSLGRLSNLQSIVDPHTQRLSNWQSDINQILKDAVTQAHPFLLATAVQVQVTIAVHYITNQYRVSPDALNSTSVRSLLTTALKNIEGALNLSLKARNLEAELRSRLLIADIYELLDRKSEAQEIARYVLPKAKAMEYASLVWRAEAHLTGKTLLGKFKEISEAKTEAEEAEIYASFTDDQLSQYAKKIIELSELPLERLAIVERDCSSRRDISNEKLNWCRHLELIQDLEHEQHRATHYAKDPTRYCKCLLLGHESRFGDPDWHLVIGAFKRAYCEGCAQRTPYTSHTRL
jgi:hypothetical protein